VSNDHSLLVNFVYMLIALWSFSEYMNCKWMFQKRRWNKLIWSELLWWLSVKRLSNC